MKATRQRNLILITTIFAMTLSLFNPGIVLADDGQPPVEPAATEEPVVIDAQAETSEPVATDEPVLITEPTSVEETVERETSVQEILEQIPDEMAVIVLDEQGQLEPMATEAAAETILTSDPMWCPTGQIPGDLGCTIGYATAAQLIAALNGVSGDGTIYFTSTYSTNDLTFDQTNANLAGLGALTIQGGWNGSTGNAFALSGSTTFDGVGVSIINWTSAVTINDIIVNGASNTGLWVETTGDIILSDVQSSNNLQGAFLDNRAGSGTVTLNGTNTFNGNLDRGLGIFSNEDVLLNGTNTFNDNDYIGLEIQVDGNGDITVNNVTANGNPYGGVSLYNMAGQGSINITGTNTFNNNGPQGLYVMSNGNISLNNITANENSDDGVYLNNCNAVGFACTSSGSVTISGTNIFSGNTQVGLNVFAGGDINVNNITANNNLTGTNLNNFFGIGSIYVTGVNTFNNNDDGMGNGGGLLAQSNNAISLHNITANHNAQFGMFLENNMFGGSGGITISGTNVFIGNGMGGVNAVSYGDIIIENVTASDNGGTGLFLWTVNGNVEITCGTLNNNTGYGLSANIPNTFTLNGVVFGGNTSGEMDMYGGGTLIENPFDCPSANTRSGSSDDVYGASFLQTVQVNNGDEIEFNCESFRGTALVLSNGDKITFKCPISGSASLAALTIDTLPDDLPEGFEYISGVQAIQSPNGSDKALDGQVLISFLIPESFQGTDFAILYWDGSHWLDLNSATFTDGREVFNGGHLSGDGYFEAVTNFSGSFVFVTK